MLIKLKHFSVDKVHYIQIHFNLKTQLLLCSHEAQFSCRPYKMSTLTTTPKNFYRIASRMWQQWALIAFDCSKCGKWDHLFASQTKKRFFLKKGKGCVNFEFGNFENGNFETKGTSKK